MFYLGWIGEFTAMFGTVLARYRQAHVSFVRMVELFTRGPLGILGRERKIAAGQPADLTIFSLDRAWTYQVERSPSKSRNSPFDGKNFKGGPVATIVAGRVVYRAN